MALEVHALDSWIYRLANAPTRRARSRCVVEKVMLLGCFRIDRILGSLKPGLRLVLDVVVVERAVVTLAFESGEQCSWGNGKRSLLVVLCCC